MDWETNETNAGKSKNSWFFLIEAHSNCLILRIVPYLRWYQNTNITLQEEEIFQFGKLICLNKIIRQMEHSLELFLSSFNIFY